MLEYFQRVHYNDYMEFAPMVDGSGGVIPEVPEDLAKHRKKVPMMIGTTKDESSLSICKPYHSEFMFTMLFQ